MHGMSGFSRRCNRTPTMKLRDKNCTILPSLLTKPLLDLKPLNPYKHREEVMIAAGKITFPPRRLNGPLKLALYSKIKPCSNWPLDRQSHCPSPYSNISAEPCFYSIYLPLMFSTCPILYPKTERSSDFQENRRYLTGRSVIGSTILSRAFHHFTNSTKLSCR